MWSLGKKKKKTYLKITQFEASRIHLENEQGKNN